MKKKILNCVFVALFCISSAGQRLILITGIAGWQHIYSYSPIAHWLHEGGVCKNPVDGLSCSQRVMKLALSAPLSRKVLYGRDPLLSISFQDKEDEDEDAFGCLKALEYCSFLVINDL